MLLGVMLSHTRYTSAQGACCTRLLWNSTPCEGWPAHTLPQVHPPMAMHPPAMRCNTSKPWTYGMHVCRAVRHGGLAGE
jgi:hypothetical protein